jgi:hypothetical protein
MSSGWAREIRHAGHPPWPGGCLGGAVALAGWRPWRGGGLDGAAAFAGENALPCRECCATVGCVAVQAKLTSRQRTFLLGQGYLVVRSQLAPAALGPIKDRLGGLVRETVAAWAEDPSLDTTEACVVAEFGAADPGFAPCSQHPLLADAAALVLGDAWHVRGLAGGPDHRARKAAPPPSEHAVVGLDQWVEGKEPPSPPR